MIRLTPPRCCAALPLLLAGAGLSGGCGGPAEAGPDGGLPDVDDQPTLTLQEELRIGSLDDPDAGFSDISHLDVDRDGNVYVFERQALEIRAFDPSGRPLRTIGRRGEGPGESIPWVVRFRIASGEAE